MSQREFNIGTSVLEKTDISSYLNLLVGLRTECLLSAPTIGEILIDRLVRSHINHVNAQLSITLQMQL